jgi:tRNA A-37 threonylcarbamoyl transferase component Bud32
MNLRTDTLSDEEAAAQPPLSPEQLTPHFPQLEILECLGRGGMGVVYKARQKSLNRLVALKLLAPERARESEFAERFTREAHALAALNHPHIVTVYDFGQAGGFYFLLMEFVDGVNLRQSMNAKRFTPEQALAVVPAVCEALQYAHEHGIVHRDIKPENLLLDKDGRVKIADFGIAKMLDDVATSLDAAESQPAGTPQYMAPEQKDHQRADHRADIYSLGVVLYEMLTGELPATKLQAPSSRLRGLQIDVRLDEIVLRALEKEPELRYQTAAEMRTQLETITTNSKNAAAPDAGNRFGEASNAASQPETVTAAAGAQSKAAAFKKCVAIEVAGVAGILALGVWCGLHRTADTAHVISGVVGMSAALLLFIFSVPMALRLTPRNAAYGFRFRESFESERQWREINEHGGRQMMVWCWFNVAFCAVSFFSLATNHQWAWTICILLSVLIPCGATYWWAVETNPRVPNPQTKQLLVYEIVAAIFLVSQAVQYFVVQPYKVRTQDLALELPAGTWRPLWKVGRPSVGEAVMFDREGRSQLGRVLKVEDGKVVVQGRDAAPVEVRLGAVTGRIVLGVSPMSGPNQEEKPANSGQSVEPSKAERAATPTPAADDSISLAQAVNDFNKLHHAAAAAAGKSDLTEEAVIAAIRWAMIDRPKLSVTNATFATLGRIVEMHHLPKGFVLELLASYEPNDRTTFDVWSVRLRIPGTGIPHGTTGIMIDEEQRNSHVIGEEERKVIHAWQEKDRAQGGAERGVEYQRERAAAASIDARNKAAAASELPPAPDDSTSLAQAVNDFNKRYHDAAEAAGEPDLTVEAVLAAIRWAMLDRPKLSVTNATFATLGRITETQALPKGFELELLIGYEPNDQATFAVWSVRLRIPGTVIPNGTTCIMIHEQQISSHVIGEEERKVIHAWQEKERAQGGVGSMERAEWGEKYRRDRAAAAAIDTRNKPDL